MKKEHFKFVCEYFDVDRYCIGNAIWLPVYQTVDVQSLVFSIDITSDVEVYTIKDPHENHSILINIPLHQATEILIFFKETEVMFM